jgi:hypothetical protein
LLAGVYDTKGGVIKKRFLTLLKDFLEIYFLRFFKEMRWEYSKTNWLNMAKRHDFVYLAEKGR